MPLPKALAVTPLREFGDLDDVHSMSDNAAGELELLAHAPSVCVCGCNPDVTLNLKPSDRRFLFALISHLDYNTQLKMYGRYSPCLRLVAENIGYRLGASRDLKPDMQAMDEICEESAFIPAAAYIHTTVTQHAGFYECDAAVER